MEEVPIDDSPAVAPVRRASSRLSNDEPSRAGSPWSAGHEVELRQRVERDLSSARKRLRDMEIQRAQLKAAYSGKEGAKLLGE